MVPKVELYEQHNTKTWNRVRCSHIVTYYPNSARPIAQKCKHNASWLVDGVPLCTLHGGRIVLPLLAGLSPGLPPPGERDATLPLYGDRGDNGAG